MQELRGCRGKKITREMGNLKTSIPELEKYLHSDGNKGYRLTL